MWFLSECGQGLQASESLNRTGGPGSEMADHRAVGKGISLSPAFGRMPQVCLFVCLLLLLLFCHTGLSTGDSSALMTPKLTSISVSNPKEREGGVTVPFGLVAKVTHGHFHFFLIC